MMILIFLIFLPNLLALHIMKETANLHLRPDIKYVQSALKEIEHEIIFGIEQKNLEELEGILYDVSDPDSENYGKHWTKQQVAEFTNDPIRFETVKNYLESFSSEIKIKEVTLNQEYIKATAPVKIWERMFDCTFHVYKLSHPLELQFKQQKEEIRNLFQFPKEEEEAQQEEEIKQDSLDASTSASSEKIKNKKNNKESELTVIRTNSYSLPIELEPHLFAVFNTVQFPHPRSPRPHIRKIQKKDNNKIDISQLRANLRRLEEESTHQEGYSQNSKIDWNLQYLEEGYVTPRLIELFYEVYNTTAGPMVSQGILESLNEALDPADLTLFQQYFGLLVQPVSQIIGGHVQVGACLPSSGFASCAESNLDVQYVMALAQNVPTIYWYIPDTNNFIDWMDFVTVAANSPKPADVYSISYTTYEYGFSKSTAKAFNTEAIKLGVMGTTILAASGDDGVAGFLAREGSANCGYFPQYPASSPYVTAVGGTTGVEHDQPEVACEATFNGASITTGGGFSTLYPMPLFQKNHVDEYFRKVNNTKKEPFYDATTLTRIPALNNNNYKSSYFNISARGYPDISLFSSSYQVFMALQAGGVDGTSASAPVMAAFVNLVNYQRKLHGNSSMGWINPFLYKKSTSFVNDITIGANNCSALYNNHKSRTCCKQGFSATTGWDPLTGLGTVNFRKFLQAATGLVTTPPPTLSPTKSPVASPTLLSSDSVSDFPLFDGAYAGIAIGGAVFLLIAGGLFYFIYTRCCMKNGVKKGNKKTAKVMSIVP